MVLSNIICSLAQFVSWLSEHQWSKWEIIAIAAIALFVSYGIIRRQRKKTFRNIYGNQFLESTPIIGSKLGVRKRRRHLIEDFKKTQKAAVQKGHLNKEEPEQKNEPEKLREDIKLLQYEILKHKKNEVHLEEKVAYLTSANEKLQLEISELKQSGQIEKLQEVEPDTDEKSQPEISVNKQIEQHVDQEQPAEENDQSISSDIDEIEQDIEESKDEVTEDKTVSGKLSRPRTTYEDLHRVEDDIKQKLCRKCNEWKAESEFHKNASSKDGLAGTCKTCKAEAAKKYRRRRKSIED